MFETIETIDWINLTTASGNALQIPKALNDLLSEDDEVRDGAFSILLCGLVNQGNLYDSAYYAIPLLHEVLKSPNQKARSMIYELLYEIGNKHVYDFGKAISVNGQKTSLKVACRNRVFEGRQLYYQDLQNTIAKVRYDAFELLVSFDDYFVQVHSELRELRTSGQQFYEHLMLMNALELHLFHKSGND